MTTWTLANSGIGFTLNALVLLLAIIGYLAILRLLLDLQSMRANTPRKWKWLVLWSWCVWILIAGTIWIGQGYQGPELLRTGFWADVTGFGWSLILTGVVAAVVSIGFWIRKLSQDDPKALVSRVPRVLPLAPELRAPKDGMPGFSDLLAKLPGNHIFNVQIIEEQVRLPRLPAEWEGLSILHLSDLHLANTPRRAFFEKVMSYVESVRPDMIVLTGDIVDKEARLGWIPNILSGFKAPLGKYYVLGDHDYSIGEEKIRDVMEMSGWRDVGRRFIVAPVRGQDLLIMGTQRPWTEKHTLGPMGTTVNFSIVLSHYPHHLEWASNRQFDLLLAGHPTGGSINLPWPGLIGPSSKTQGLHYRAPTLMNVSHGLGRSSTMTFNHKPGMTRLVLHGPNPADHPPEPLAFDGPVKEGTVEDSEAPKGRTKPKLQMGGLEDMVERKHGSDTYDRIDLNDDE